MPDLVVCKREACPNWPGEDEHCPHWAPTEPPDDWLYVDDEGAYTLLCAHRDAEVQDTTAKPGV